MVTWRRGGRIVLCSLVALCATAAQAEDTELANVLRLPEAKIEETSATPDESPSLAALTDGDPSTVATASATNGAPFSIVFGFGGETVAVEELTITLPPATGDAPPPARVDLLASTQSPHSGFQSVRTDPLAATADPQRFSLRPTGARWIMLRFTPAAGASRLAIADVALVGREGLPVTHYQFKESPAKAFDVLRKLERTSAIHVELTSDEVDLFEDARDGTFDTWSFDEAALLASGVVDAAKRQEYLKRLDQIETEARSAAQSRESPFEQAPALLKYLHTGPMSKGYAAEQTDVAEILDSGTFNCVSSATLFNIVGRRLGLDCRAVEVPQHAFSIVYDGVEHADVETTTDGGFNPARDEAAQEEFTKLTGFAYIPDSNRDQRREIGEVGLVAITHYNHGVTLGQEKRFHEALVAYFRAMSLDPECDSAVKNALAVLANWSLELAEGQEFEEALNVLGAGLDLAPEDAALVNNRRAVWSQWAESLMERGENDEAIALLRRAAEQVPDGDFIRRQAWVFIRQGEEAINKGDWEAALAIVDPGLHKVDALARDEISEWGGNLYFRWAQSEQEQGHFDEALGVIERALAEKPDDDRLVNHLAYLVQERGREIQAGEGAEQAERLMAEMLARYGAYDDVQEVAESFAYRTVNELTEQEKYDDALAAAQRLGRTLKNPELARSLSRSVYDNMAEALVARGDWEDAIDTYTESLTRFPADEHLANNLAATWSQWAGSFIQKDDWAGALAVFENQRKRLPEAESAETNIRYCIQQWTWATYAKDGAVAAEKILAEQLMRFKDVEDLDQVARGYFQRVVQDLSDDANYDEALAAAGRSEKLLADKDDAADLRSAVYDAWANVSVEKQDWQAAIDVYANAINAFPKNDHLQQNAVATWNQWAKVFMDKEDWTGAGAVYERALEQFPDNGLLKNNLAYCQEKASQAQ